MPRHCQFTRCSQTAAALALVTLCCSLAGCGKKTGGGGAQAGANAAAAKPAAATQGPNASLAIDADLEQLARRIEEGVQSGSPTTMRDAMDWDALMDRIAAGLDPPAEYRRDFLTGMRGNGAKFDEQILRSISDGGSFRLLRLRLKDGQPRALYRMLLANGGGVNYIDVLFVRSADGQPRMGDMFMFIVGEDLSQSLRRTFAAGMEHQNRNVVARLTGQESAYIRNMPKIMEMTRAVSSGNHAAALAAYRSMDEEVQTNKQVLALRLRAAQGTNDEEYLEAIRAMLKHFGKDPSIHLVLIDSYALRGAHQKMLESVDALDAALGGDPYLNVMRANAYLLMKDLPAARKAADAAMRDLPDMVDGYFTAIAVALEEQRFDEVVRIFDVVTEKFALAFENLGNEPIYAEFIKSPQYEAWRNRQPANIDAPAEATATPDVTPE
ncbi:MAG: hypothetical protein AB7O59_23555 [Pirellulales bacterium]